MPALLKGTAAPLGDSGGPGPSALLPHPPVALTPTLPNPICNLAARRPRLGPHPRSPSSRGGRTVSSSPASPAPGAGSGRRGLRNPGVGGDAEKRAPSVSPAVGDPLPPFKLPPSHTSLQISLYFEIDRKKKIQICLFASLSLFFSGGRERPKVPPGQP